MALIRVENVSKRFGKINAVDGINFSIEDGEYVCVLGPTGAGKTTLLRIIAGLLEPDEGRIYIGDRLVNNVPPERRNTIYMFQQYALFPHMNALQNVSFGPTMKGWPRKKVEETSRKVLTMVRLADRWDAFPSELSGGMQQRLALARGIASGARILLLDEPLGALDARLRVEIRHQLRQLVKDQGLTAVHVTHDQEEALSISDHAIVLRNGRIEQIGTPGEIYAEPKSIFVAHFVGGANFIEGIVSDVDQFGSLVAIRGGLQIRVLEKKSKTGERVVVAIRPENMHVKAGGRFEENNLPGIVTSVRFLGSHVEYDVELEDEIAITCRVPISPKTKFLRTEEKVSASFLPDRSVVFPYPKTGLLKETEAT